jgi:KDO2-lipid IV(A) lauroyltransferase
MSDATPAIGADSTRDALAERSSALPPGLRTEGPVPRIDVLGTRDGFAARLECWMALALIGGVGRLPMSLRSALVSVLSRAARTLDRKHTTAARTFLRQAFGPGTDAAEIERRVVQAYAHLFHITIDSGAFDRRVPLSRIHDHFVVNLSDRVREVIAARRGCIVVTAHVGDWEGGSAILPWVGFDPVYAVSKPPKNRPLSEYLQRMRERRGLRLLPRRGAMRHARAILDAGGTLILLLDQRSNHKPVLAPFFGRMARCDRSAGVLMRRLGAPVLIGAGFKTERPFFYEVDISRVVEADEILRQSPEEIATRINMEMERLIRRHPEQYFWLHDRYRDTEESRDEDADAEQDDSAVSAERERANAEKTE